MNENFKLEEKVYLIALMDLRKRENGLDNEEECLELEAFREIKFDGHCAIWKMS